MSTDILVDGITETAPTADLTSAFRTTFIFTLVFQIIGMTMSWSLSDKLGHDFFATAPDNVWFQADTNRVFSNMVWRDANHYRTKVHPLFSIATNPPVELLRRMGLLPSTSVRLLLAIASGGVLAGLFLAMRLAGTGLLNASIFTLVAASSASFVFFCGVPETFVFGSLSIMAVTVFCASLRLWKPRSGWFVAITALSMSMATTNVSTGIFATLTHHRWRKTLRITLDGLLVVIGLWVVEKFIYPSAMFFFGDREESRYAFMKAAGGPLTKLPVFLWHSMVLPRYLTLGTDAGLPALSVQHASFAYASAFGATGGVIWTILLAYGLFNLCTRFVDRKFRDYLLLSLGFQLALHLVYGDETFLYSLHWVPLLVLVASMSTLRRGGLVASVLGCILIVSNAVNNGGEFLSVAAALQH